MTWLAMLGILWAGFSLGFVLGIKASWDAAGKARRNDK